MTSAEGFPAQLDFDRIPDAFRITCKYMLWGAEYETDTRYNARRVSNGATLRSYFYDFCTLAIYLDTAGVKAFGDVTSSTIRDYIETLQPGVSIATRVTRLLRKLYLLGPRGAGLLPDGLAVEFTEGQIKRYFSEVIEVKDTPIIPDTSARSVANAAIEFLGYADHICTLCFHNIGYLNSNFYDSKHTSSVAQLARKRYMIDNAVVDEVVDACSALKRLDGVTFGSDFESPRYLERSLFTDELLWFRTRRVSALVQHLVGACFIVTAALTGFRAGEIFSIGPDDIRASGSGAVVRTRISKNMERRGGVEVDRPGPEILLRVKDVLSAVAKAQGVGDFWRLGKGGNLRHLNLTKVIQQFCEQIAGIDDWEFTSRQFRRYFAIFFIRRFQGPDDALRRNFRHVSVDTLKAYVRDKSAADYLLNAKQDLAKEIYADLALDRGKYASRDRTLLSQSAQEYAASNLPLEEIEKAIERVLDASSLEVWPTLWGYCMLQKDDDAGAMCKGKKGLPTPLEMYPGNCGRCRHMVVGLEHKGFWTHTKQMHTELVENPTSTIFAKRASEGMIQMSDAVIARIPG